MRRIFPFLLLTLAFLAAQPSIAAPVADDQENLTVLADQSLAMPLAALARDYTYRHGAAMNIVLLGAQDTAQQIAQGLDADILITADRQLRDSLSERGLVDVYANHEIAETQLALVAPNEVARASKFAKHISFAAILYSQPNQPIYVTDKTHIAGDRAHRLMQTEAYSANLQARTLSLPTPQALLDQLHEKPGFALMLATDALRDPSLSILTLIPEDVVVPVTYQASLVAGTQVETARDFLSYLASPEAQATLRHYGFRAPRTP